jgi:hypothetical protein
MDRQEIFDKVKAHLLEQGCRSVDPPVHGAAWCKYRGPRGLKCAIGALIPDEVYDPRMEMKSIGELVWSKQFGEVFKDFRNDLDFLRQLQEVHDEGPDGDGFKLHCEIELQRVATAFGLKY